MYKTSAMPFTLDYNTALCNQYDFVASNGKKLNRYGNIANGFWAPFYPLHHALKKMKGQFIQQLIYSKGMLSQVSEHIEDIRNKDTSELIDIIEQLINKNIELHSKAEEIVNEDTDNRFPEFHIITSVLLETIENFYSTLRIIKRVNRKTPIERTTLAESSVSISAKTLEKIFYER